MMSDEILMRLLPTFILMAAWLSLVGVTGILAHRKKREVSSERLKKQLKFISIASLLVIVGDIFHSVGFTMSTINGTEGGVITLFGSSFPLRIFAMPFDLMMFTIFYLLWFLFTITRYQDWNFKSVDKSIIGLFGATFAALIPNLFVYNIPWDYILSIYSPHMILFISFGLIVVAKMTRSSKEMMNRTDDEMDKGVMMTGQMFVLSFVFFTGTIALLPYNSKFSMLMIPKTLAYMAAYVYILKDFVLNV